MSEIKTNKTSAAEKLRWLKPLAILAAYVLWRVVGFFLHMVTTLSLLDFVARVWVPPLPADSTTFLDTTSFLLAIFTAGYIIAPLLVILTPDDTHRGKRFLLAGRRHFKLLTVIFTLLVVAAVVVAHLVAPDSLQPFNNTWIHVLLAHWVLVLLLDVTRRPNLPSLTKQSDSDLEDEAGAK